MELLNKFLDIITSGRLSSTSSQPLIFIEISQQSPIIGVGFGSVVTTDMGFLEIFVMSGILGLSLYLFIFLFIIIKSISVRSKDKKEKILLFFIWIILLFSSIGGSAITANRISVFIWVITTLLLIKINKKNLKIKLF